MPKEPRLTLQSLKVLKSFLGARGYKACGADIVRQTGLFPGTAYPILARFKDAGWLSSEWEDVDASDAGRPPRLYYKLTGVGQRIARERLSEIAVLGGGGTQWA